MDWPLDVVAERLWVIEPGWVFGWALLFSPRASLPPGTQLQDYPAPAPQSYVNWTNLEDSRANRTSLSDIWEPLCHPFFPSPSGGLSSPMQRNPIHRASRRAGTKWCGTHFCV